MIRSSDDFRLARERLGYSQADLGELFHLGKFPDRTIRRWECGESRIPRVAAIVLEAMLAGYKPAS
jgi:transcriptional regulator with XRE-family HTH domain